MMLTAFLMREAEKLGFVIFWIDGAYRFAPCSHEADKPFWSAPFQNVDMCANAAIDAATGLRCVPMTRSALDAILLTGARHDA